MTGEVHNLNMCGCSVPQLYLESKGCTSPGQTLSVGAADLLCVVRF